MRMEVSGIHRELPREGSLEVGDELGQTILRVIHPDPEDLGPDRRSGTPPRSPSAPRTGA